MEKEMVIIDKKELINVIDATVMRAMHRLPRQRREFYTKRQVKELFNVNYSDVDKWESQGHLKRDESFSKKVIYFADSVENFFISRNLSK